jgi:drug/metabolite transporter (DMT)-like permease
VSRSPRSPRTLGFVALGFAIVFFSLGSTIVKKAGIPGPTMAFWRMLLTAASWTAILWFTEHRTITRAELRRALVPGVVFGLNIVCFFTGVTKTSVANAEFIGSLTPLIVVPAGAILFHEKINTKALWFGLLSIVGLTIVLFNAPPRGSASWTGNFLIVGAVCLWAAYLLTSRRLRETMSVQAIMAAIMPIAAVTVFPITLATGNLDDLTVHSLPYIVILALLTGTLAHGMIVYAQRTVPVDGKFTPEQRKVYQGVLDVQKAVIAAVKPGVTWQALQQIAESELRKKGGWDESYTYGIGHFIGMEVHENGDYIGPLKPGMVIAIEQGAIVNGTRVAFEDDVLVTATGHENLTAAAPKSAPTKPAIIAGTISAQGKRT